MEVDQEAAGCETQDQGKVTIPSEEQAGGTQPAAARSYECTFCKRGFTNAQALGGHMNIHRKEKAKLKQSTSLPSSKMPVEIPKIPTAARLPWVVSSEGHGHGRGENATLPMEETLVGEVRQLPLFIEKPSNMDRKLEVHQVISTKVASDQKMVSSLQHETVVSELDLELRLGLEPHNSTSSSDPTGNTRPFF